MEHLQIQPNTSILLLNSDYNPIHITSGRRAIVLLLKHKAQMVSKRVIRLLHYIRLPFSKLMANKPTRALIYKRDGYECMYCGSKEHLTIDHIIPSSRGGKNEWDNLTTACNKCNVKKGNRTPDEANMRLIKQPQKPFNKISLTLKTSNNNEWKTYVYE